MTLFDKNLENIVDIKHLNLKVGHPNGRVAQITKICDCRLANNVIIYGVLVVTEYCANLTRI